VIIVDEPPLTIAVLGKVEEILTWYIAPAFNRNSAQRSPQIREFRRGTGQANGASESFGLMAKTGLVCSPARASPWRAR
jgi:hypothetical protein